MSLLHFVNCLALACAPYLITYRYSGLLEFGAFWRCLRAGGAYFVTQLVKMLLLATFFPSNETGTGSDFLSESTKCTVDLVDLLGLYLVLTKLSAKGEMKVAAAAVGWGTAELVGTKVLPLWFGARGIEFDWRHIQSSLDSNVNLVYLLSMCALLWLWSRHDLSQSLLPVVAAMLLFLCYRPVILYILRVLLVLNPWLVLAVNMLMALVAGIVALQMYIGMTQKTEYQKL